MNPDDLRATWKTQSSQTHLAIDTELLLQEVRRNQRSFAATIFWRDVREVGVALVLVPVWIFLGIRLSLPWTWYSIIPALLWAAGFMLVDRRRHNRQTPDPGEPLRCHVEHSLAQMTHQIWLLKNVFWWYLLPLAVPMLAFLGQVGWNTRSKGWSAAFAMTFVVAIVVTVLVFVYWINQYAVRNDLEPRRQELQALLASLKDEPPAAD
jgi:hypothetical protein